LPFSISSIIYFIKLKGNKMYDLFAETRFYFVKTDDNKYSLFSIATDKLILADVEKSDIDEFLQNNNPNHPSQPGSMGSHGGLGSSILFPLAHDAGVDFYDLSLTSGLLDHDSDHSTWNDFIDEGAWFGYENYIFEEKD
jgi:hypothetical protein